MFLLTSLTGLWKTLRLSTGKAQSTDSTELYSLMIGLTLLLLRSLLHIRKIQKWRHWIRLLQTTLGILLLVLLKTTLFRSPDTFIPNTSPYTTSSLCYYLERKVILLLHVVANERTYVFDKKRAIFSSNLLSRPSLCFHTVCLLYACILYRNHAMDPTRPKWLRLRGTKGWRDKWLEYAGIQSTWVGLLNHMVDEVPDGEKKLTQKVVPKPRGKKPKVKQDKIDTKWPFLFLMAFEYDRFI